MNRQPCNLRNLPLEDVRMMRDQLSRPVYDNLIKKELRGHELHKLRSRLLNQPIVNHSREYQEHESLLRVLYKELCEADKTVQEKTSDVNNKRQDAEKAYEAYMNAKSAWESANKRLSTAISAEQAAKKALAESESLYATQKSRLRGIDTIVLVHRSANIGQLVKHCAGKFIVTESDANFFGNLLKPDAVFDSNLAKGLFNSGVAYELSVSDLSDDEKSSIVHFVEMAMYYYVMQDRPVVMLYANSGLDTILKREGI